MSRPWPNTALWQRVERTFRTTHGSRWRTAAAAKFRVKRSDLRRLIDRENFKNIEKFDEALIDHMHQHAEKLRERADDVCNVARDVMRARNEVGRNCLIEVPIAWDPGEVPMVSFTEPLTDVDRINQRLLEEV